MSFVSFDPPIPSATTHAGKVSADEVVLRGVRDDDLDLFFLMQIDEAANYLAAFCAKNPRDREAFDRHWAKIRGDANVMIRTIVVNDRVAGHVAAYGPAVEKEVTYWISRPDWGRGIATAALSQFLSEMTVRPLFARAAADNTGSIRVLAKCGFVECGRSRFFANARGAEVDEAVFTLASDG